MIKLPRKWKQAYTLPVVVGIGIALITVSQYFKGTPFIFATLVLPMETWLLLPVLGAGIAYRFLTKQTHLPFKSEIAMEPSEKLFVEFLRSPEKARFGAKCDRPEVKEVHNWRKTGDVTYRIIMDDTDWILLLDGRVNPPNGNRAYSLMPWNRLHQNGFNSLYDMERKLSGITKDPIAHIISDMDPEDLTEFLKVTGGKFGAAGGITEE